MYDLLVDARHEKVNIRNHKLQYQETIAINYNLSNSYFIHFRIIDPCSEMIKKKHGKLH